MDVEYLPAGQFAHAVEATNGSSCGFDMNFPAAQHPSRPVVDKSFVEDKESQVLPHNVRLKPLSRNTVGKRE